MDMHISRRIALALAATLALPRHAAMAQAPQASARLLIASQRWTAARALQTLGPLLAALAPHKGPEPHTLLLLPRADPGTAPAEARLIATLARLARTHNLWLATAAPVSTASGAQSIGLLLAPDGTLALRTTKATPDLFLGFTDTMATLDQPMDFPIATTPFGQLGLLVGEDAQLPGLVRGTMLAGAELLLNPSSGAAPGTFEALAEAPSAMAYENWNMVAVATPEDANRSGLFDWRGQQVRAAPGQALLSVRLDVAPLRQARAIVSPDIYDNFPVWLRDALYAEIFAHQARQRPATASPRTRTDWQAEGQRRLARQSQRQTPEDQLEPYYLAYIAQPATMATLPAENRRQALVQNIDTALATIGRLAKAPNARLALFPEFCFSGAGYRSIPDLLTVACELPGPEVARLQDWARENRIYTAAQFMEADPKFPNRAFNTAVLIDDSGEIILKHRKLQCVDILGALPDTTPASIHDDYVAAYGLESLYAIADTPLGKIGVSICFELNLPEVMRAMTLAGAEIILHLTAEGYGSERHMWHAQRRKRALENQAYLLCANKGYDPAKKEPWVPYGESQFIDFRGRERDRISHNGPGLLIAPIDMASLRAARADLGFNLAIWDEPGAYAHAYAQGKGVPNNLWSGDPLTNPHVGTATLTATRDRYYTRGTYQRPAG